MNFFNAFTEDRFGPDLILTHWMLYFDITNRWLARKKLGKLGKGAEVRPQVTIIGGKNISLGDNVVLRPGTYFNAAGGKIIIGDNVLLGPNIYISTTHHHFADTSKPILFQGSDFSTVVIKEGSWIGVGVTIFNNVSIGKNSVVGAGSVVTTDVPDYCVAAGVPAKIIKRLK